MPAPTIGQQAIDLFRKYSKKSDVARELLDRGYSVSEISKAVPMAYSQVHSIAKGMQNDRRPAKAAPRDGAPRASRPSASQARVQQATAQGSRPAAARRQKEKVKGQVAGQVRFVASSTDLPVGPCANCKHEIVIRRAPVISTEAHLMLIHVGVTTEEYLDKIQFCQAVPQALILLAKADR